MTEIPNYYQDTVSEYLDRNQQLNAGYKSTVIRSKAILEFENLPQKFFDIHTPIIYNKQKFKEAFARHNKESLLIKSIYANQVIGNEVYLHDNKIKKPFIEPEIIEINKDKQFFSINDRALTQGMINYITKLYPKKSKHEQPTQDA